MRNWICFAVWVAFINCARAQIDAVAPALEIGIDSGRIFVSTNAQRMPYYLVGKDFDFPSKLGKKVGTNDLAGVTYTTEAQQSVRMVNGNAIFWNYYVQRGRYAFMNGTRLTLVDFELVISHNEETPDELLLVTCGTKSLTVSSPFLEKLESLRKSSR
jgi:hypothetical protein